MRCTQIAGLTEEAKEFLEKNCILIDDDRCPHCEEVLTQRKSCKIYEDATNEGMFEDGPMLHEYNLVGGKVAREVIQAVPWSSGPCIFMCLEIEGKRMFEWSQEEIDNC